MVSRTERTGSETDRRSFLAAAGATAVGGALATGTAAAADTPTYHLTQGENCIPLRPFTGDEPVTKFYDYRTDRYSSYGTRSLQRPNTSLLFLYAGPNGVSLVLVHGKLGGDGDGGSVTFDIAGLPTSGEWLVKDDDYDGPNRYDRWRVGKTTTTVDWTWDARRADGGVFGPIGDSQIEIDPAFNEHAALYGDHYTGTVTDWQALSGDESNPKRVSLDRTEPITIAKGSCPTSTTAATTRSTSTARSRTTTATSNGSAGSARPTTSGSVGPSDASHEIERLLERLARVLRRLSKLLDRAAQWVGRFV